MRRLLAFLKDERNRALLRWLGGGLMAVAAAAWTVYVYVYPPHTGGDRKPPLRVSYLHFDDKSIPPLLGELRLPPLSNTGDNTNTFVVKNAIYNQLSYLYQRFSISPFKEDSFAHLQWDWDGIERIFGTVGVNFADDWFMNFYMYTNGYTDITAFYSDLANQKLNGYLIGFTKGVTISTAINLFSKLKGSEYQKVKWDLPFYQYLAQQKSDLPLFQFVIAYEGCVAYDWVGRFVPKILKLQALVLENVSDKPIALGNFKFKELDPSWFYDTEYNAKKEFSEAVFPQRLLLPKETIIIPLYLYFDDPPYFYRPGADVDIEKLIAEVNESKIYTVYVSGSEVPEGVDSKKHMDIEIQGDTLVKLLRRSGEATYKRPIFFSSVYQLADIQIEGVAEEIRPADPRHLVFSRGGESGSCPYVYTYNEDGSVAAKGQILTGRSKKAREGISSVTLQGFNGTIVIKEVEPETSYIRWLRIKQVAHTGESHDEYLLPDIKELHPGSSDYVKLARGEELVVHFQEYKQDVTGEGAKGAEYILEVFGYYVADEESTESTKSNAD